MIFDHLCGIAERHLKFLMPILERTKLFVFPYKAQEVLPKEYDTEQRKWLAENFALPFRVVAIEDRISVVLFIDPDDDTKGLIPRRVFVELLDGSADPSEFGHNEPGVTKPLWPKEDQVYQLMLGGVWGVTPEPDMFTIQGALKDVYIFKKNNLEARFDGEDIVAETRTFLYNPLTALEEFMAFNSPFRFVLEVSPKDPVQKRVKGRLLRTHERPTYTLLTPREIRDRMHLGGTHAGPIPHERRRHTRTFRSERYVNAKGKVIWIPATWVGTSEKIVGFKKYKVRLDL